MSKQKQLKRYIPWASILFLVASSPLLAECNTAPTAVPDAAQTVDESLLVDVLSNDSDPEGQALTVSVVGTTCPGSATVDFDLVTLTPAPRLTEDCVITYRVTDEGGLFDTGTVTVALIDSIFSDDFETGDTSGWDAEP